MFKHDAVKVAAQKINELYNNADIAMFVEGLKLPSNKIVADILDELQKIFFPAYFSKQDIGSINPEGYAKSHLQQVYEMLYSQVQLALALGAYTGVKNCAPSCKAAELCDEIVAELPEIYRILMTDVQAGFDGDPAAKSKEEIVFSYPGFYAIFVYRIAHLLYKHNIPYVGRMMTELAHNKTGIDIHPGAEIGEYFFIDHGTGVVIGETAVIGKHVKLYQGVTLGALSLRKGQLLAGTKRHPTVEDNVTIYSGASVLGGNTVIGEGAVIGGNVFLTESVGKGAKVSVKAQELIIKGDERI